MTGWIDTVRSQVLALPALAKFAIVVAVMVGVPRLAALFRLPAMVGLLLFGIILGPHVLSFLGEQRPVAEFFAELGKLLLMFSAGLEIDLGLFRRAQTRSMIFGIATTSAPLLFGTFVGLGFGDALIPAIVVGSLLASHTLLGIPVVSRLRRDAARAGRRHDRCDRDVGHALANRVRGLRLDLYIRFLAGSSCDTARRDCRICLGDPFWIEPSRNLDGRPAGA